YLTRLTRVAASMLGSDHPPRFLWWQAQENVCPCAGNLRRRIPSLTLLPNTARLRQTNGLLRRISSPKLRPNTVRLRQTNGLISRRSSPKLRGDRVYRRIGIPLRR